MTPMKSLAWPLLLVLGVAVSSFTGALAKVSPATTPKPSPQKVTVAKKTTSTKTSADSTINFNRDIRPILSENCFYCHGQDNNKREADLRLDVRQDALDYGAILPGKPDESLVIERILSHDAESIMPPPKSNRQLTDAQKKLLERWISQGAKYQTHWAYEPAVRPAEPVVSQPEWVRNPIDLFVLAKLDENNMKPSPEASRETLMKRLSIDLTGLPPTPDEVVQFVNDKDPKAYEKLVDRLLASPHYGERMALPWLDAARYADSNGFQQDGDTWQWIWRDWVVQAYNDDLPFDKFTIWQLAGDLLPNATNEQKIASAFNRNHLLNGEGGAIAEEQRFANLFDRIDTTATTWLGLTMACAQCHDHKYDPISQADYYSLLDAFNQVPETGRPQRQSSRIRVAKPFLELPTEENKKYLADLQAKIKVAQADGKVAEQSAFEGWKTGLLAHGKPADANDLPGSLKTLLAKPENKRSDAEKNRLQSELRKHFNKTVRPKLVAKIPAWKKLDDLTNQLNRYKGDQLPRVMIMSDDQKRDTHILDRGEYLKKLEKVSFNTPAFLPSLPKDFPKNRLGFARWLMMPSHPLTARVQVNRMWQHFFGTGIVKTSEDFGVQSEFPIHGELLDWLAVEFQENGWSTKSLHRLIVTSATYRQSSKVSTDQLDRDRENRLYGRASRFRMPSLILRDWALASSGLLERRLGGVPVYPYQPNAVWEALAITKERDFTYPTSKGSDLYRRSLYTFWRRTVGPANMFDASNRQTCRVRLATTSTPLHALTTLNDPTWVEAARVLAQRSIHQEKTLDKQLADAFTRVLCRHPKGHERQLLERSFHKQLAIYQADKKAAQEFLAVGQSKRDEKIPVDQHAAMTAVCLALLNLDEALTRE